MNNTSTFSTQVNHAIPSCLDIGLKANRMGDFQTARHMLQTTLAQLEGDAAQEAQIIELTTYIADTYMNESNYDLANDWYVRALHRSQNFRGTNTLESACLMSRLAEVNVLQSRMPGFQNHFEELQRVYLLCEEIDLSPLLRALVDLTWVLCLQGHTTEVRAVNSLIEQLKQLAEEYRVSVA